MEAANAALKGSKSSDRAEEVVETMVTTLLGRCSPRFLLTDGGLSRCEEVLRRNSIGGAAVCCCFEQLCRDVSDVSDA